MFKSIFNQTRNLHPEQNHDPPTNQLPTPDNTCCLRCVLCAYGRKARICALVAQVYCEGCRNNIDHYQKSLLTVAFLSIRTVQRGKCELQRDWIYALFMKDNILLWKQYLMFLDIFYFKKWKTAKFNFIKINKIQKVWIWSSYGWLQENSSFPSLIVAKKLKGSSLIGDRLV